MQLPFHWQDGASFPFIEKTGQPPFHAHNGEHSPWRRNHLFIAASPHWQDRVSRPFIAAILSLGRRSWPLFHANPKLSTVSSQDQWLRLNELGHLRYDAKTRAPVLLLSRRGQEPHFYCEDGTATHSSPNEPNQMCILVSNLACWVIRLKLFACWVSKHLFNTQQTTNPAQVICLLGFFLTNNKQQAQLKFFACWVSQQTTNPAQVIWLLGFF